jgi:phospholipid/cholesterol/gamma-HCH transport system substrate-binding protein
MKVETRVGLIFLLTIAVIVAFAYLIGSVNPFSNSQDLVVLYNYAGGIEVGSSVRVMGIKVGKVESIDFDPNGKDPAGEEVKLKVRISVSKKAWPTIRRDSKFFINIAGLIGEKFLEISPGSTTEAEFEPGQSVRGEDPPRVDQLISQSYGLAGKLLDMVEKNKGGVTRTLETMDKLVTNLNRTLVQMEKTTKNVQVAKILKNIEQISSDLAFLTAKTRTPDGEKTLALLHTLIWRLEGLDGPAIKKFLQEEGIRAHLF